MSKPPGWRPLTENEKQEIIRRYAGGEGLALLAEEYHRDKGTLRPVLRAAGLDLRPRGNPKGIVWSAERREAHRLATSTPEFAQKSRESLLARLPSMRGPATNTPIEKRLHDALKKAGLGFTAQSLLLGRFLVDIEIRQAPIVIEADGAQHTLRDQKAKDAQRDAALVAAGYRIFRFTGSEINRDATVCVQRVIDACGLVPESAPVTEIRTSFAGELHPRWKGGKREFTCDICGEIFLAQPAHRPGPDYYCTVQCAGAARRGKKLTTEHRAKIGAGMTGNKRGPHTAATRAKISETKRRRIASQIKIKSDPA